MTDHDVTRVSRINYSPAISRALRSTACSVTGGNVSRLPVLLVKKRDEKKLTRTPEREEERKREKREGKGETKERWREEKSGRGKGKKNICIPPGINGPIRVPIGFNLKRASKPSR